MRWFLLVVLAACNRPTQATDASPAPTTGWGSVMVDVGRRFELSGRAAQAGRFELAEYEADELGETFEDELSHAALPKEGPVATLPPLAADFAKAHPAAMKQAAHDKNRAAFETAFQKAAEACNSCHRASGHGFIEIPSVMGKAVPSVE